MIVRHVLYLSTALLLASPAVNGPHSVAEAGEAGTRKLLTTIDCTKDYGPDDYFGFGDVRVVQSPAGKYREAGPDPESRFGYRFAIEQVGGRTWPWSGIPMTRTAAWRSWTAPATT